MSNTLAGLSSSNIIAKQIYTEHQYKRREAIAFIVFGVAFTIISAGLIGTFCGLSPSRVHRYLTASIVSLFFPVIAVKGLHSLRNARRVLKEDREKAITERKDLEAEIGRLKEISETEQEAFAELEEEVAGMDGE